MRILSLLLVAFLALTTFAAPNLTMKAFAQSGMGPAPDFDNDGFADLAVGVPREDITLAGGGAVNVLYGTSSSGLSSSGDQFWHQDVSGIEDSTDDSENFGFRLAAGDFDGDGQSDLAIGVVGEMGSSIPGAGAVNVIYGSTASGLSASGDQIWSQNSAGV